MTVLIVPFCVIDGTHETSPMTVERLRFLEAAMKEAMSMYEDPNDVVRESVKKMKEEGVSGMCRWKNELVDELC